MERGLPTANCHGSTSSPGEKGEPIFSRHLALWRVRPGTVVVFVRARGDVFFGWTMEKHGPWLPITSEATLRACQVRGRERPVPSSESPGRWVETPSARLVVSLRFPTT